MKNVNAPKSSNVWVSIATSLFHLIVIGIKKHGVGSNDKLRPFS
jgi:hypothetical protein